MPYEKSEKTSPKTATISIGTQPSIQLDSSTCYFLKKKGSQSPAVPEISRPYKPLDQIHMNRHDEFFIALGKKTLGEKRHHVFVMLGVMKEGKPIFLARLGKSNIIDSDVRALSTSEGALERLNTLEQTNQSERLKLRKEIIQGHIKVCMKMSFFHTEAELQNESLHPYGPISYSAYAIPYEQYKQFLKVIPFIQKITEISCYQPIEESDDTIIMEKRGFEPASDLNGANEQLQGIVERSHYLSLANNCRHTAIELTEYTLGISHLPDNVSRFFTNLPVSANFSFGVPEEYFYVFPLPPDGFAASGEKKAILIQIYQRMENLLKKDPYGENTIQKFEALKKLYNEQAGIPNNDLQQALDSIKRWKTTYQDVVCQLRAQSLLGKLFVWTSSTKAMADDIEHTIEKRLNVLQG
ncbi:hypothetical protein [Legionella sp.]|uniref:hypothetical protein n=1 Tax=Legionella sp. TaxID=459 RepID=UPI00321F8D2C